MQLNYVTCKVLSNVEVIEGIYKLHVEGKFDVKPGQFYMLNAWKEQVLLPRPISIHDVDENGIYFLYQTKGKGTNILSKLTSKDEISILGPLGNGFDIEKIKGKVAVVAGGIGIAPLNYVIKKLESCEIDLYCGFRDEVYGIDSIEEKINKKYISTDTGRVGHKGFVTDLFQPGKYDVVLCCGPEIMMSKVAAKCREANVPVYVSMEKFMACGLGACLVCTCKTIRGNKRTCADGPVFLGEELILDA
ncbi:dihydroorotate dehydrogenase electron transfer subunit [Clostridium sp. SYSU_GA19001]|uniref:dihydroorotate dehydrogenase electron transfer subunit n=1 Tax=Clostridium caldaquaticum TaxID=2940653 RepID=UPI002076EBA8|nr:dihydroorotate dehydrogenase electron transfer subunit [Clostridium caldaquaticum]MCM8710064.1 dihydroorotate dehydrogenase electron transfer subunit [Clostridium caldaquaticum]